MNISLRNGSLSYQESISFNASIPKQDVAGEMKVIQAVLMSCIISVTGTGNALVIVSFAVNKNLRTPSNYLLLNLAVSDFLTGTFSLPLYLTNYIINGGWVLGKTICKLWLTIDYTLCQCTIYNIVLISFDRFLAVTKAVKYRDQQNRIKPAFVKMAVVWITAFLIFGPAIIFWEHWVGYSVVPEGECNPEFYYNGHYLLYSSIFDFFTPMTAIAYFNLHIYFNIRSRMKKKNQLRNLKKNSPNLKTNGIFLVDPSTVITTQDATVRLKQNDQLFTNNKPKVNVKRIFSICKSSSGGCMIKDPIEVNRPVSSDQIKDSAMYKDKKMAKSLAALVCTFCICWAPYSLFTIIQEGFCERCIPSFLNDATCWLFFLNSMINPFLYPLCHPAFKKTLLQVLCIKNQH